MLRVVGNEVDGYQCRPSWAFLLNPPPGTFPGLKGPHKTEAEAEDAAEKMLAEHTSERERRRTTQVNRIIT